MEETNFFWRRGESCGTPAPYECHPYSFSLIHPFSKDEPVTVDPRSIPIGSWSWLLKPCALETLPRRFTFFFNWRKK
jgi:hypothetical protein